ncbi:MAG: hypothetical protein SH848_16660, partial [Saprospiraceae bacterium]|nr:hypothetical protein [Saprospiraceae bacterium]
MTINNLDGINLLSQQFRANCCHIENRIFFDFKPILSRFFAFYALSSIIIQFRQATYLRHVPERHLLKSSPIYPNNGKRASAVSWNKLTPKMWKSFLNLDKDDQQDDDR